MTTALVYEAASVMDWARDAGTLGAGLFALVFVVALLALLPASLLTTAGGFVFGAGWGTLFASTLGTLAATLAFLIGRSIARPWMQRRLARYPRLNAFEDAIRDDGFRLLFLLRLASVVPFVPLSYALGASRIRTRDFVLATWLGALPGTLLYAYLGSVLTDAAQLLGGNSEGTHAFQHVFTWTGLAVLFVAVVAIARVARQSLNHATQENLQDDPIV